MRLSEQIGDIAQRILGPPNKALSTRHQFRFGTNGSVAVDISGPKTGTYFNHETHKGGGWRELLLFEGGIAQEDVEEWLEREGFGARAHRRASSLNAKVIATYDYHDENGVLLVSGVPAASKDVLAATAGRERRLDVEGKRRPTNPVPLARTDCRGRQAQ